MASRVFNKMLKRAALFGCLLALGGCGEVVTEINGNIIDEQGKPVAHAKVWLIYGDYPVEAESRDDGNFAVSQVHFRDSDSLTLLISKEGRPLFHKNLQGYHDGEFIKIVLLSGTQTMLQTPEPHKPQISPNK